MSQRFIRKDVLEKVRTLSAFDYLRNYAPDLLVKNGRTDYYHRDHDSLHFSNGKWYWWSQGKGGTSALDYLIIESTFGSADRGNKPYSHLDLNSVFYLCDVLYQQGTLTDRTQVYLTHINQEQDFIHEEMVAECEKRKTPYKVTVAYDGLQMADYKK